MTRLAVISHASNVTGTVLPVTEIARRVAPGPVVVDGAAVVRGPAEVVRYYSEFESEKKVTRQRDLLIVFGSVQRVMRAEQSARDRGLDVDTIPAPFTVSSECGVVLEASGADTAALSDAFSAIEVVPQAVYRRTGDSWIPSALDAVLDLAALQLLPGAYQAAATGLVPAGTGKNRDSISAVLDVPDGADPVLVDLALDPQTSGGLLAACPPSAVDRLLSRLPEIAVVGRCSKGVPGRVSLR